MKKIATLFLLFFLLVNLFAQNSYDRCHLSTEGVDFWFGFMEGRDLNGKHYLEINVTAREATTFSVYYGPNETPLVISRAIQPDSSVRITIPLFLEPIGSEKDNENKGIHLVSEKPVNVFALNYDKDSNDAAVIYPTESLGTEYFAMCYTPSLAGVNGRNSEFVVVASQDNTTINITPTVETDQHRPAGKTFEVKLNKGQVYQVQSMNTYAFRQGDLTGTSINSNKPIAVFSGSLIAIVPFGARAGNGDHLFEQIPPVQTWGRKYYTVPFEMRDSYRFRVMSSEDNTVVFVPGFVIDTLNRGEFKEYLSAKNDQKLIISDKPILVAEYSQSSSEDVRPESGANLEPFMIILSPIEQMRNSANFVVYQGAQTGNYYLFIITTTSQISNIRLDGKSIPAGNFITSGNGYYTATIEFDKGGVHNLLCTDPKGGLLAYEYSYGFNESFGYPAALNLDPLLDLRENLSFGGDTLLLCYGSELKLDAGPYFAKYNWSTGDTTQSLIIKEGDKRYYLTVTDAKGCSQSDTVYVFTSHPVTDLGVDSIASCAPFSLPLDAGAGFKEYSWSTGEITQKITVFKTGIYSVIVTDKYGCKANDNMKMTVFPIPEIELQSPNLICSGRTTQVQLKITGADPTIWKGLTKWDSDNSQVNFSEVTDSTVRVTVVDPGDYNVFFHLSTTDGCDTVKQFILRFYDTPTSNFIFPELGNDQCGRYSREVLFTGTASTNATFKWEFGSSLIVDNIDYPKHFRISKGIGSNPEIYLVVDDHGCRSDTTRGKIIAIPNFTVTADPLRGCDTLKVSFFSELIEDEPVDYLWDFGNDIKNTTQNPTINYRTPGFKDVRLTVTNRLNGCKAAFLFEDMVKIFPTPVAKFTVDPNMCYDDSLDVIYLNNIDSSICYWTIQGGHRGPGNDSIRVYVDLPRAFIQLKVTEFGCSSTSVPIPIKRKPHFDFTTDITEGCQPLTVNATGVNKDGDQKDLTYYWMLDGRVIEMNYTYQYFFPLSGKYNLGVVGRSQDTYCRDTIQKPDLVWVHPKPVARFEMDHPITYIDYPQISFTNRSQDAVNYYWDFGDKNYSWAQNPNHNYEKIGIYNPRLISESQFGCLDTMIQQVTIIPHDEVYSPNAFRPDSDVPENRYFIPVEQGVDPERFTLRIYDRWGQLIFESFNVDNKWDGKTRNGKKAPMGNYVWTADYYDLLGFEHHVKGQVLLIR